jgi:hypothetical protein
MSTTYVEQFANPAWRNPVTVPAGALVRAAGTVEWWDLAGGWATWPGLPAGGRFIMRLYDPLDPGEVIRAIELTGAGQLRVVRGDNGTAPAPHPAGFRLENVITAAGLRARAAGVVSGNGLALPQTWPEGWGPSPGGLPRMRFSPIATWNDLTERPTAGLIIPGGEAAEGAVYEAVAFGYYTAGAAGRTISFGPRVSGTGIGGGTWPAGRLDTVNPCRWRVHGWLAAHNGMVCESTEVMIAPANAAGTPVDVFILGTVGAGTPVALSAAFTWNLWARLNNAGMTITVQGGRAWRAA